MGQSQWCAKGKLTVVLLIWFWRWGVSTEWVIKLGAITGALTATLSLIMWVYNKLVTEPNCKLASDIQVRASRELGESISPLIHSIDRLSELLDDSQKDRDSLHDKDKQQDKRMDGQDDKLGRHDNRITIIETWKIEHEKSHK